MPVMRTVPISSAIKVATIFEPDGTMQPAWFQIAGRPPVRIEKTSAVWYTSGGPSRLINFEVIAGGERYCLTFDTGSLEWSIGQTVIE